MELLQGESLDHYRKTRGPMPHTLVSTLLGQLADALDQAHSAGVIHRDLKPSNLFMTWTRTGLPVLKVVDFGIAKTLQQDGQHTATQVGSPAYAAPEQLGPTMRKLAANQGITIATGVSPATDVWACGLVAYELLTGLPAGHYWRTRPQSDLVELMMGIVLEEHPPPLIRAGDRADCLPPGFDDWFGRCVRKSQSERWQSVGEMFRVLESSLNPAFTGESRRSLESTVKMVHAASPVTSPLPVPPTIADPALSQGAGSVQNRSTAATAMLPEEPGVSTGGLSPQVSPDHDAWPAPSNEAPVDVAAGQAARPAMSRQAPVEVASQFAQNALSNPLFGSASPTSAPMGVGSDRVAVDLGVAATKPGPANLGGRHTARIVATIAAAVVALLIAFLWPATEGGGLIIQVNDAAGVPVQSAEVFIDGQKKCDAVPCIVGNLSVGQKSIRVGSGTTGLGLPVTEVVEKGKEKTVLMTLSSTSTDPPPTSAGLKIEGSQPDIQMELAGEGHSDAAVSSASAPSMASPHPPVEPATPTVTAPALSATLNMNSIPKSKVLLDGRPLGGTPIVGHRVSPGEHTVSFIHPKFGKKSLRVVVQPGQTKPAMVRFSD